MPHVICAPLAGPVLSQKPCDCVEVHPAGDLLAVSTYELAADGSKSGAVELFQLPRDGGAPTLLHTAPCDAVFGSKWIVDGGRSFVVSATSSSGLTVHALDSTRRSLEQLMTHRFDTEPAVSCLSVDIRSGDVGGGALRTLILSRSDGTLAVCELFTDAAGSPSIVPVSEWSAHTYAPSCPAEVWCAAWRGTPHHGETHGAAARGETIVWSGGDDARLKGWDTRCVASTGTVASRIRAMVALQGHSPPNIFQRATWRGRLLHCVAPKRRRACCHRQLRQDRAAVG